VRALSLAAFLLIVGCHTGGHDEADGRLEAHLSEVSAILELLHQQRDAWNEGDIEGFMARGYWNSDELVFVSGDDEHRGYDAVLERYRKRYTEGGAEMGELSFIDLHLTPPMGDSATVTGRWNLEFERSEDVGGRFILSLERKPVGWRIVRDETTSD